MVPGQNGAGAGAASVSQIIHYCSVLHHDLHQKEEGVCVFLFHPPSFHFLINSSLYVCVVGPWPPRLTCTTSVSVSLQNGFTTASMLAPLTTSWYFSFFNSVPKMRFKSVGAENHNSSIVPRTAHQF